MESYEKKYKDALERMKSWAKGEHPECFTEAQKAAEFVFPELKESEGEKIRKELMDFVVDNTICTDERREKWIAWIEKQGEPNTVVVIPKFREGDVIRHKGSTEELTIESISGECYHGKGWGLHISCDDDYELVKQKPSWNEDDDDLLVSIEDSLSDYLDYTREDRTLFKHTKDMTKLSVIGYIDWLKSIKQRMGR